MAENKQRDGVKFIKGRGNQSEICGGVAEAKKIVLQPKLPKKLNLGGDDKKN